MKKGILNNLKFMESNVNNNFVDKLKKDTLLQIHKNKIINGTLLSKAIQNCLMEKIAFLNKNFKHIQHTPKLKIILVGNRLDSKLYVENKLKMCKVIGIKGELKNFPENIEKEEIIEEINKSNEDNTINGIIVQLPLPNSLNLSRTEILSKVHLNKDVDGLNPLNQGKVLQMSISDCLIPPTAMGVLEMLRLVFDSFS